MNIELLKDLGKNAAPDLCDFATIRAYTTDQEVLDSLSEESRQDLIECATRSLQRHNALSAMAYYTLEKLRGEP